jgi:V8-like Glu-specific endopeptidase
MSMKGKFVGVCLGLASTLAACAPGDVPEETTQEIIGGEETEGDPAVVALYGREPGATSGFLCTSTLISPTVLMMAAHCVDPRITQSDSLEWTAIFAPNIRTATDADKVRVVSTHFDSAFDPMNLPAGNDIAVAILERPVTVTPRKINRKPLDPSMAWTTSVRLVGYGLSDANDNTTAGLKREVTTLVSSVTETHLGVGFTGQTICSGDSGGPGFLTLDGEEVVAGVASFGLQGCWWGGSETRVDLEQDFLQPYLDMDPPPPTGECAESESEPNSRRSTASVVCEETSRITGTMRTATDLDWFKFEVPADSKYTVTLSNLAGHYNMRLYKKKKGTPESSTDVVLVTEAEDTHPSVERTISKSTPDGGVYYLRVWSVDGSFSGTEPYGLTVEHEPR